MADRAGPGTLRGCQGLSVDQRNALIDELMATRDFTVAATNGRVTIQRVWDQYLASTKPGITGE
ncbi:hypothetical protein [Limosilactobacillus fermentum]|uniref:hypothetical protein n=1 Tax=Limosilactobacillus fermentum TaxID=1613 RepID=UPI0022E1BA91|nr:hypothetical protein [Limosilactobacillus fermentum]